tara:strand:- start:829 stop:1050 length:222 start_codon:yes stop_codon:yes gene_type:complete
MLEIVKRQIIDSGVKQSFIAKHLGISTSMMSLVLSGQRKLSDDKWDKLMTFLSVARNYNELLSSNNATTNSQI